MMIFIKFRPQIDDVDQVLTTSWWFRLSVDHKLTMLIKFFPQMDEFGQVLPES